MEGILSMYMYYVGYVHVFVHVEGILNMYMYHVGYVHVGYVHCLVYMYYICN